jgi:hypothetical protein
MRISIGQRDDRYTVSATVLHKLAERLDASERSREDYYGEDAYMQWGFKLTAGLQYAIDNKLPFVIVDWGYFSARESSISVSFNGFHGLSMPVSSVQNAHPRWYPTPEPWKEVHKEGDCVTVFGQLQNDRAVRGLHVESWLRRTAVEASEAFGLPAKIRPHPKMISSWEPPLPPLEMVLDETAVAVTYTSSVGILTALAGVPTVALHPASPAYAVAANCYEIVTPTRTEWLHDLSWRNYNFSEMDEAAQYISLGLAEAVGPAARGMVDTEGLRV